MKRYMKRIFLSLPIHILHLHLNVIDTKILTARNGSLFVEPEIRTQKVNKL